jgi:hypothetical protein
MESIKNGRDVLPQAPPPFAIQDPASGKCRQIADMTTEEIDTYAAQLGPAINAATEQLKQAVGHHSTLISLMNLMQFEKHRRSRSGLLLPR